MKTFNYQKSSPSLLPIPNIQTQGSMSIPYPENAPPVLVDIGPNATLHHAGSDPLYTGTHWTPVLHQPCTFPPDIFLRVMNNFIKNPNINTSWLFRADIIVNQESGPFGLQPDETTGTIPGAVPQSAPLSSQPALPHLPIYEGFNLTQLVVRTLVPRNTLRDDPMNQTCLWYHKSDTTQRVSSLIVYIPHGTADALPYYHPNVRGVAHLHEWSPSQASGSVSVHYLYFGVADPQDPKLGRTALRLLGELHKHGQGQVAGYKKRVHHDVIIPQARTQNQYTKLKQKYASNLVKTWSEKTDPTKHVFEDLGIAAFLIELWQDMYTSQYLPFPGFVDIGCGNGLLVYILRNEGFNGWGFDARARASWATYSAPHTPGDEPFPLQTKILLPALVTQMSQSIINNLDDSLLHNGVFPPGTFIISNHADELTPWTPLVAAYSECPFLSIPCCSHNLAGDKFRALPPRDRSNGQSTYASLVDWVAQIGEACGYEMETEMLRIPSTRNTGLLGRRLKSRMERQDLEIVVMKFGGSAGYLENVIQLLKGGLRGH